MSHSKNYFIVAAFVCCVALPAMAAHEAPKNGLALADANAPAEECVSSLDPTAELVIPAPTSIDYRELGHLINPAFPPEATMMRIDGQISMLRTLLAGVSEHPGDFVAQLQAVHTHAFSVDLDSEMTQENARRLLDAMHFDIMSSLRQLSGRANRGVMFWKIIFHDLVAKVEKGAFRRVEVQGKTVAIEVSAQILPKSVEELSTEPVSQTVFNLPKILIPLPPSSDSRLAALEIIRDEMSRVETLYRATLDLEKIWLPGPAPKKPGRAQDTPGSGTHDRLLQFWDDHPAALLGIHRNHPMFVQHPFANQPLRFSEVESVDAGLILSIITSYQYSLMQPQHFKLNPAQLMVSAQEQRDLATLLVHTEHAAVEIENHARALRIKIRDAQSRVSGEDPGLRRLLMMQSYFANLKELNAAVDFITKGLICESNPEILDAARGALRTLLTHSLEAVFGRTLHKNQFILWDQGEAPPPMPISSVFQAEDFFRIFQRDWVRRLENIPGFEFSSFFSYVQWHSFQIIGSTVLEAVQSSRDTPVGKSFQAIGSEITSAEFFLIPLRRQDSLVSLTLIRRGDGFQRLHDNKLFRFIGFSAEGVPLTDALETREAYDENVRIIRAEDDRSNRNLRAEVFSVPFFENGSRGLILVRRPLLRQDYATGVIHSLEATQKLREAEPLILAIKEAPVPVVTVIPRVRIFDEVGTHNREVSRPNPVSPANLRLPGRGGSSSSSN